jgi:large subunit ribosomal protein L4
VPFGPTPRTHNRRLNNKEVKLAMRGVLSGKVRDNELVVVDNYGFDKPSTKQAVALLKALELEGKRVTLVVSDDDVFTYLSFRNVETVRVLGVGEVTTHTLIDNAALVLSTEVAKKLEEVLA